MPDTDKDMKKRTVGNTCEFDKNFPDEWDWYTCADDAVRGESGSTSWLVSFSPPRPEFALAFSHFSVLIDGKQTIEFAFNEVKFRNVAVGGAGWIYDFMVTDLLVRIQPLVPTVRCSFKYCKA